MEIIQLTKTYSSGSNKVVAVDNLSVTIPDNAICGLLGNNGAGKTTLLKCVVGLLKPSSGDIRLNGKTVSVVLDGGRNLINYMTVSENIKYFSLLQGKRIDKDDGYITDITEALGVRELYGKQVQTLSFGMRQRASIAVALACRTDIIFMDEPTNGLDVQHQEELVGLIQMLRDKYKCTFVICSHDMRFVEKVCTHCILIDHGRVIHEGEIAEFKQSFSTIRYALKISRMLDSIELEKLAESIGNDFSTSQVDEEEKSDGSYLRVIWPNNVDLGKLFVFLRDCNVGVYGIEKEDDLGSVISDMSRKSNGQGENS